MDSDKIVSDVTTSRQMDESTAAGDAVGALSCSPEEAAALVEVAESGWYVLPSDLPTLLEAVHVRGVVITEDGSRREVAFDVPASSAVAAALRAHGVDGLSLADVTLTADEAPGRG
jgi:hypothetical protein